MPEFSSRKNINITITYLQANKLAKQGTSLSMHAKEVVLGNRNLHPRQKIVWDINNDYLWLISDKTETFITDVSIEELTLLPTPEARITLLTG